MALLPPVRLGWSSGDGPCRVGGEPFGEKPRRLLLCRCLPCRLSAHSSLAPAHSYLPSQLLPDPGPALIPRPTAQDTT